MSVTTLDFFEACGSCGGQFRGIARTLWYHANKVITLLTKNKDTDKPVEVVAMATESTSKAKQELKRLKKEHRKAKPVRRLQFYDSVKKKFGYGIGGSGQSVYLTNLTPANGKFEKATTHYARTNLSYDTAEAYIDLKENEHIDFQQILNDIKKELKKYLYYEDERLYTLLAMWASQTYIYQCFSFIGYLHLFSKDKRMGKTRTLEVMSQICYESTQPLNAPSAAFLRTMANRGGTNAYDTLERWKDNKERYAAAMDNLDAGFRFGGTIALMVPRRAGAWNTHLIEVFAPYMLSGIYENSLSETARDRAFSIEVFRKPTNLILEDFHELEVHEECAEIRKDLYVWGLANAVKIADDYRGNRDLIKSLQLNDRATDIWKPLFSILATMGLGAGSKEWNDLAGLARKLHLDPDVREREEEHKILQVFRTRDSIKGTNQQFQHLLKENGIDLSEFEVTHLMKKWNIKSKSIRPSQGLTPEVKNSVKGYELKSKDLERLNDYLSPQIEYHTYHKEQVN